MHSCVYFIRNLPIMRPKMHSFATFQCFERQQNSYDRFDRQKFEMYRPLTALRWTSSNHTAVKRSARAQFLRNSRQNPPYKKSQKLTPSLDRLGLYAAYGLEIW